MSSVQGLTFRLENKLFYDCFSLIFGKTFFFPEVITKVQYLISLFTTKRKKKLKGLVENWLHGKFSSKMKLLQISSFFAYTLTFLVLNMDPLYFHFFVRGIVFHDIGLSRSWLNQTKEHSEK